MDFTSMTCLFAKADSGLGPAAPKAALKLGYTEHWKKAGHNRALLRAFFQAIGWEVLR